MTDDRSLERAARSWLEEGPTRAPERAVEAALAHIQSIPQERGLLVPWRLPMMTPMTRVVAATVVAALAIGGSVYLFGREGGIGSLQPQSSGPVPVASASMALVGPTETSGLGACRLITAAEATALVGDEAPAGPAQSGSGDETSCVYTERPGEFLLRIDLARVGGATAFGAVSSQAGMQLVPNLGSGAAYDPNAGRLYVLKGDSLLVIEPRATLADRLGVATRIAELALERL